MSAELLKPDDLKGRVEWALAREYSKDPFLRTVVPQLWRSTARKKAITLVIQANPTGDEMAGPGSKVYQFDVNVSVQARATKVDPCKYIAAVDKIHATYGEFYRAGDKAAYEAIFPKYGVYVYGAWPKTIPSAIENMSHLDYTGLSVVAFKLD